MAYDRFGHAGNAIQTTLTGSIGAADTSANLTDVTGWVFTPGEPFWVVMDPGQVGEEKMLATSISGNTLTGLVRGADGTAAAIHDPGAVVMHIFSAQEADEANQTVVGTIGQVAAKGDLLSGAFANLLTKTPVGADGLPLVASAAAGGGIAWAQLAAAGIANGAVTAAQLGALAVTAGKIAPSAVTSTEIADGTIATGDLADLAVTAAKIANTTITSSQLASSSVTNSKIAGGAVTFVKFASNSLQIGTFSVTTNSDGTGNFPHSLSATPNAVFITPISPSSGAHIFTDMIVTSVDGTLVNFRAFANDGTALNTVAITGYYMATGL